MYIKYSDCYEKRPMNKEEVKQFLANNPYEKGACENWRETSPMVFEDYKRYARYLIKKSLKTGKIKKPLKCTRCKIQTKLLIAHHLDYCKPLLVIWYCRACHYAEHIKKTYRG